MTLYLDASIIVSLFTPEPTSDDIQGALARSGEKLAVSDFGAGEVSSALSRKVRERTVTSDDAIAALHDLDEWRRSVPLAVKTTTADIARADRLVREFRLKLRFPDALHIAMCEARQLRLVTRDRLMADAVETLGVSLMRLD